LTTRRYTHNPLKFYKLNPDAKAPVFATEGSACFDIHASLIEGAEVELYAPGNWKAAGTVIDRQFKIHPGERVMIPTNLIFDIPEGWSVRIHPRSGISLKHGLILVNQEGIIDSDYVEPVFILLTNTSSKDYTIHNDDRICQGEMVISPLYHLEEIKEKPTQKTDREGGFGSTGTK
jgi:dUTP pyrophosphatase